MSGQELSSNPEDLTYCGLDLPVRLFSRRYERMGCQPSVDLQWQL